MGEMNEGEKVCEQAEEGGSGEEVKGEDGCRGGIYHSELEVQ